MTKQLLGIFAGVMGASALIAAQGTAMPPQASTDAKAADVTVTGCLTQGSSPTVYVLNNAKQHADDKSEKGMSYVVVASSEDLPLAANLNHEVSVMGSADKTGGSTSTGAEKDLPRFSAKTLTSIADRCTATAR